MLYEGSAPSSEFLPKPRILPQRMQNEQRTAVAIGWVSPAGQPMRMEFRNFDWEGSCDMRQELNTHSIGRVRLTS